MAWLMYLLAGCTLGTLRMPGKVRNSQLRRVGQPVIGLLSWWTAGLDELVGLVGLVELVETFQSSFHFGRGWVTRGILVPNNMGVGPCSAGVPMEVQTFRRT